MSACTCGWAWTPDPDVPLVPHLTLHVPDPDCARHQSDRED